MKLLAKIFVAFGITLGVIGFVAERYQARTHIPVFPYQPAALQGSFIADATTSVAEASSSVPVIAATSSTLHVKKTPPFNLKHDIPVVIVPPSVIPQVKKESKPVSTSVSPVIYATSSVPVSSIPSPPPLPPLDEEGIERAVVKIECPAEGIGTYTGSGFVLPGGIVVTAAHVVKDSASPECEVIFSKDRFSIYHLKGTIQDYSDVARRHDEDGIDVAILRLPPLDSYPEAKAIFDVYPSVPYPVCTAPQVLGDASLHFGYPSNYKDQNYLSEMPGELVVYADINGIREQLSQDQRATFKSPVFAFTGDESALHPYLVSRVGTFYGDSGGLAFDATKQCILGPHRGSSMGSGEHYSIFMMLGWVPLEIWSASK